MNTETRNVPMYQVDFCAKNKGKNVSLTKKAVKFVFGYASYSDIANGATGANARGEEHEVEVKWSFTSGRRYVYLDSIELHSSVLPRLESATAKFELKFKMKDYNHSIHLICHSTTPRKQGNYQPPQFDLIFSNGDHEGKSFFDLPKIFELGPNVDSIYASIHIDIHASEAPKQIPPRPAASSKIFDRSASFNQTLAPVRDLLMMSQPRSQSMRLPNLIANESSSLTNFSESFSSKESLEQIVRPTAHVVQQGHPQQQQYVYQRQAVHDPFVPKLPSAPTNEDLLHRSYQDIMGPYNNSTTSLTTY